MKPKLIVLTLGLALFSVGFAQAKQTVVNHKGREVVVHTNPVPVILHRLVPPNYGRHVTVQELKRQQRTSSPRR
jgi:hypothetical protein